MEEVLQAGSRFGPEDDPHELGEELGSGAAARVYVCTRQRTGERLAVKVINLRRLRLLGDFDSQMLKLNREVQILSELQHPRIVNLHFVHRTANWIFLVMELVRGGELFDQIVRNRTLQEVEAKYIFRQLLDGVGYMHSRNVIHRDLKPENILIHGSQPAPPPLTGTLHEVKIADFGLSKVINEGSSMAKTFVGTPQYWAPEVLNVQLGGSYTQSADFWSLGAVLFVMLCGRYPFDGKKMPLEDQIRTANYSMNTPTWQRVSAEAKDMVRGLLKVNSAERLSLEECLRHPWLVPVGDEPLPPVPPPPARGPSVTEVSSSASVVGGAAAPMVTQPSNSSDVSDSSVHIEQAASYGRNNTPQKSNSASTPPTSSQYHHKPVPSIQVGGGAGRPGDMEQETIFCLSELLKLQVSIAGSLEMACLAFRHTDTDLADAIRRTFWQARDLFSHAANVVSRYSEVAQQVGQLVLADLKLAVDEKEPSLAVSLLGMVKGWVANMKKDGEEIQERYMGLQDSVHGLIRRVQHAKTNADRHLAEAVQAVEAELAPPPLSPRACLSIKPGGDGGGAKAQDKPSEQKAKPPEPEATKGTLNVPFSMNVWTRQLFEQLSQASGAGSKEGQDFSHNEAALAKVPACDADDETWKRDVLELLFMAPGLQPSQLPKVGQFGFSAEAPEQPPEERCAEEVMSPTLKPSEAPPRTDSAGPQGQQGQPASAEDAIVRFIPSAAEQTAAEAVTNSAASLLRALRELKRVDEILHGCSAFWANMDGTVQKLAQMKEHTETLVNFAANSKALRQRFEQRLEEYTSFWASLERVCRQYCLDHQAASKRMYEVIREVADAADVFDTAQSARLGMVLAMREKQGRRTVARHVGVAIVAAGAASTLAAPAPAPSPS